MGCSYWRGYHDGGGDNDDHDGDDNGGDDDYDYVNDDLGEGEPEGPTRCGLFYWRGLTNRGAVL